MDFYRADVVFYVPVFAVTSNTAIIFPVGVGNLLKTNLHFL